MSGIDKYTISLLHFDNSIIDDICGNTWSINSNSPEISSISKWGSSIYTNGGSIISNDNLFNNGGSFTIDFWVNIPSFTGSWGNALISSALTSLPFGICFNGSKLYLLFSNSNLSWTDIVTDNLSTSRWYHIAAVYDTTKMYLFVDGVIINSVAFTYKSLGSCKLNVGKWNSDSYPYFGNNYIDELRISSVARWTEGFTPPTVPYTKVKLVMVKSDNTVWGKEVVV